MLDGVQCGIRETWAYARVAYRDAHIGNNANANTDTANVNANTGSANTNANADSTNVHASSAFANTDTSSAEADPSRQIVNSNGAEYAPRQKSLGVRPLILGDTCTCGTPQVQFK